MYIKLSPIGHETVAPVIGVGIFGFDDLTNLSICPFIFLALHFISPSFNKKSPLLGYFFIVVSVICILSFLVRLYSVFPSNTLF